MGRLHTFGAPRKSPPADVALCTGLEECVKQLYNFVYASEAGK